MTTQSHDKCKLDGSLYDLCAFDGRGRLRASDFGFKPKPPHTAWARGYSMVYWVDDASLKLSEFRVCTEVGAAAAPQIAGRTPEPQPYGIAYRNLDLAVSFTGGFLLGSGAKRRGVVLMAMPWDYSRLIELTFEDGRRVGTWDRTERIEGMRKDGARAWAPDRPDEVLERLYAGFARVYRPSVEDVFH